VGARSSRFFRKELAQLRDSETAVRDPVLLVRGHLGHRAAVTGDDEERVVAEALLAARSERDLAPDLAIEELDASVGPRKGGNAYEERATRFDTLEQREQARVAFRGARVVAEEPTAAQTRRAPQRVDLEARVVSDSADSTGPRVRARFVRRVLRERCAGLLGLWRNRTQILRENELVREAAQELPVFLLLARVAGSDEQPLVDCAHVDLTQRLRWCAATTLGLALAGFGLHFPGSSEIGTGIDEWQIGAATFGAVMGAVSGVVTGTLQWAAIRSAGVRWWRLAATMAIGVGVSHALADGAPTSLGRAVVAIAGACALTAAMAWLLAERRPLTLAASVVGWAGGWILAYAITGALSLPGSADPIGWATEHTVVGVVVGLVWSGLVAAADVRSRVPTAVPRAALR